MIIQVTILILLSVTHGSWVPAEAWFCAGRLTWEVLAGTRWVENTGPRLLPALGRLEAAPAGDRGPPDKRPDCLEPQSQSVGPPSPLLSFPLVSQGQGPGWRSLEQPNMEESQPGTDPGSL